MNLREVLQAGPAKANEIFARLFATSSGAVKIREKLFDQLKSELELYADLEERHLFPVLKKHQATKDLVINASNDNKKLRARLAELDTVAKDDEVFIHKLRDLERGFQQSVRDEKKELLPAVLRAVSEEQVQVMADTIEADRAEVKPVSRDQVERQQSEAKSERGQAAQRVAEQKAAAQKMVEQTRKAAEQARKAAAQAQKAAEQKAAERAQRVAEQARKAAEQARKAAEQRAAEQARKAAEQKAAEQARKAAEQKAAEQARKAAEQKAAEQKAAEQKAAEQKAAEQARKAAEQKAAEQARKAAEQKATEQKAAEQKAAEHRAAEQARKAAEQKAAEQARKAAERAQQVAEQKAAERPGPDFQALAAFSKAATGGMTEIGSAWMDWLGDSTSAGTKLSQRLLGCRTMQDLADTQRSFIAGSTQGWMAHNARVMQISHRVAEEALRALGQQSGTPRDPGSDRR